MAVDIRHQPHKLGIQDVFNIRWFIMLNIGMIHICYIDSIMNLADELEFQCSMAGIETNETVMFLKDG